MSRFFSNKFNCLDPYVPGEQPQNKKYIKLNTNESPFPPSPIAQRLSRQAAGDLQLYSDPECKSLVFAACEAYNINSNQIIFTNGSDDVLNFAFNAFCDAQHPAVFPDITYGFYKVFAKYNNVPYKEIPLKGDFTVNVNDYIGINKNIFIANPNAPTGIALKLEEIETIVKTNPDNIVVIDEAYVDFGAESALSLINKYDNLIVVQTFSKSRSLAGGRLGMAFADKSIIADLNTVKYSTNPYNINRMTMAAGIGALIDSDYFDNCRNEIIKAREYTVKELKRLGFIITDSSANFVFVRHTKIGGYALYEQLKEKGVLIRHFETQRLREYNRITIGSMEQMMTLIKTVEGLL